MPAQPTNTPWWTDWDLNYFPDGYGQLYGANSIQQALYNTLEEWLPSYVRAINRKLGGDILQMPGKYSRKPEHRPLPAKLDVQMLVVVDEVLGEPERYNDAYRAHWKTQVSVFIFGTKDWAETEALASAYGAAVRGAIGQHPSLGGFAETTVWSGERYLEGEHSSNRQAGLVIVDFEVTIPSMMDPWGGAPLEQFSAGGDDYLPSLSPLPPRPDVADANVTVEKTETP